MSFCKVFLGRQMAALLASFFLLMPVAASTARAATATTVELSVGNGPMPPDGNSTDCAVSKDGRYVAFTSNSDNLVPRDTDHAYDAFVRDVQKGRTSRVSLSTMGAQPDQDIFSPAISGDGQYVAFESDASTLVRGDTNGRDDVFVHSLAQGWTRRVSVSASAAQADGHSYTPRLSEHGRYVAFASLADNLVSGDTNNFSDIFVKDRSSGTVSLVSVGRNGRPANGGSGSPSISPDGRFVAFESEASNLVRGDTNGVDDVFVRDMVSGTTRRASVSSEGTQADAASGQASVSADGRFVAFESPASNLVSADTNGVSDIFVRDLVSHATVRASVSATGAEAGRMSFGPPSLSADGRFVAFWSYASNLVRHDTNRAQDVFVHDNTSGDTTRVSVSDAGAQGNAASRMCGASLSQDGNYVAFNSIATNLVAGGQGGQIYLRGPLIMLTGARNPLGPRQSVLAGT
jgi:Tol biopolymer transport system component